MKGRNLILIFLFVSVSAIGAGVVEKWYTDQLQFGVKSSLDAKTITVDVGDGATNPQISVDATDKDFSFNKAVKVLENLFTVGDGTNSDKKVVFDKGAGANNAFIGYDQAQDALVFSNDGTLVKKIGSGSGSGDGGVNTLANPGFEDGVTVEWTATALRVTELTGTDALYGEKSARFDAVNQNDFIESSLQRIPTGMYGEACQVDVYWKGGDENLTAELINGNGTVIKSLVMETHNGFYKRVLDFQCAREADILGDSNLAYYKLKIYQHTLVDADAVDLDSLYVGNLKGLSEDQEPDVFSFTVNIGNGALSNVKGDVVTGCTNQTTGNAICTFQNLTSAPNLSCTAIVDDRNISYFALSNTSVNLIARDSAGNNTVNPDVTCIGTKTGADANKKVRVIKAIPTTREIENIFQARVDGVPNVSENTDNLLSGCTSGGMGIINCTFTSGIFTSTPSCQVTAEYPDQGAGENRICRISGSSPTTVGVKCFSDGGYTGAAFNLSCKKTGSDKIAPQTRNISLHGIAVNSYAEQTKKQVRIESCSVSNPSGTSTFNNPLCASWIDSLSVIGVGLNSITIADGIFSEEPVCTASPDSTTSRVAAVEVNSTTNIIVVTRTEDGTGIYNDFHVSCTGVK